MHADGARSYSPFCLRSCAPRSPPEPVPREPDCSCQVKHHRKIRVQAQGGAVEMPSSQPSLAITQQAIVNMHCLPC